MNRMYLENGNAIKPDWDGSIALSAIPIAGKVLPFPLTIETYTLAGGDFATKALSITPVVFANKSWLVYNTAGTLQVYPDHLFTDFKVKPAGDYRIVYDKDNAGVVTIQLFYGKNGTDIAYSSVKNEIECVFTLNAAIANNTSFTGYIEFKYNQVYIGTQVALGTLAADGRARCLLPNAEPLYTALENEVRFYIEQYGCYTVLDMTSTATEEVSKANMVCDSLINKGNIIQVTKVMNDFSVDLIREDKMGRIKASGGQVKNKPTWTKDLSGLTLMFNEIQSWL
jgi:hypothetical protein